MKRLVSFLLVFTLALSIIPVAFAAGGTPIINQVYGGGGKGETPIANSFVELYNPGDAAVSLTGYTLVYGKKTLALTGEIPANGSYLIVGKAEDTSDEFLTYDLPAADQTCNWEISNKKYTIQLKNGDTVIDSVTADENGATKVSKQKSLRRKEYADTDTDADFQTIFWEKASCVLDDDYLDAYAPRNSAGERGGVHNVEPPEQVYTAVVAGNTRVTGYYDENATLKMELVARYNSGAMNEDGGSLEIVQYNSVNGYAYAVSAYKKRLIAINLNGDLSGETVMNLDGTEYDIEEMITGFAYGDMTSVAVSPDGSKLAVAIQAQSYKEKGIVALFECQDDGSLTLLGTAAVGVQPDMVVFADDDTILTADEGEPRNGDLGEDPKGSVSIVTIAADNTMTAEIVYFDKFNDQRAVLTTAGALIQKNTQPSTDFEPEYIAVSGGKAYISLQEANAVAVLDIAEKNFTGVYPLGFQDYGSSEVDLQKNDSIEIQNYSGIYGIRMPDGIAATVIGGKTYILTANEGDSRSDWPHLDNEYEDKNSPSGNRSLDKKVVWFNTAMWDGLEADKDYIFGSRSFSIYEATDNGLLLKYDSGSAFEEITAEKLPEYFNCSNKNIEKDNRSGKKGPEPESVVTGVVGGRTYAFIALERIGGVMVYDISDPENVQFVNYINSREFEDKIQGDVSPEGLCFVSESDSKTGKALLLAACEVSGTLAVYELSYEQSETPDEPEQPETPDSGSDSDDTPPSDPASDNPSGDDQEEEETQNPFEDVLADAYYYDAVLWAADKKVTAGTDAAHFSPDDACTRAQAMTFLWKALGSPAPESGNMPFSDVAAGSYYYDAVLWAFESGITAGISASSFGPDEKCTRAQVITFLWKALGSPALESGNMPFGDVAAGSYYYDAVLWAFENGITAGTSASNFSPDSECTRAQTVTFLYKALGK